MGGGKKTQHWRTRAWLEPTLERSVSSVNSLGQCRSASLLLSVELIILNCSCPVSWWSFLKVGGEGVCSGGPVQDESLVRQAAVTFGLVGGIKNMHNGP